MKADLNIPAECLVLTSIGFDIHVKGSTFWLKPFAC